MKRISFKRLGILLGLLLIIGLITPLSIFADGYTPSLTKDTDGVYEISTPEQLENFRKDLAAIGSTGYAGETVVLTADIQIGAGNELSIINSDFMGTFDGLGHTITLNNQEIVAQRSIIPRNSGIIKNLSVIVVDGTTIVEDVNARSPLCDSNYGRIEYVKVEGNIKISAANTSTITVAGIAGSNGTKGKTIENSVSSINYTLDGTSEEIGAYQGRTTQIVSLYQFYASGRGNLNKCYSLGEVANSDFIKPNVTTGEVAVGLAYFTLGTGKGLTYYNSDKLTPAIVSGSPNDEETMYKDTSTKVIGVTTSELKTQATFVGWDFDKIWNMAADKNNGYPYLDVRTVVKNLKVKPVFEEKTWNNGSDLTAKVTGMEFAGLSEAEKALVEKYKITINFDPTKDVKNAAFKNMQNLGWRDVTVEYNTQPTITVGETETANTDGYTFVFDGVVTGQGRIVDNGAAGPDKTEQDAQIAKAKEANTIIFEKYIGDGSTYLTPLTVIGDLPGDKIFPQDLWAMFSAARGGYYPGGDTAFYDKWFANVKTSLHTLKEGGLKPEDMKVTEWTKLVLAITAAGYDARDIEDYDLIDIISDENMLDNTKILQRETAYLALIGGGYEMTAATPLSTDLTAMARMGAEDLNKWQDSAITNGDNAMFMQQLGFFLSDPVVKEATEHYMYDRVGGDNPLLQNGDGSFTTTGYDLNAYNNAQTMIALGCFNMNVFDDHFIQNGNTVLDSQFNFIDFDKRTYKGTYEITQLTRGFTAVIRQYEGRNQIFDTSDIVGATKAVNDQLMALTETSTPEQIAAAKAAYEKLSEAKKASLKKVNLQKLFNASEVTSLITALPPLENLTITNQEQVKAARSAYEALTDDNKALVTNRATLEKAEEKMAALVVADQIGKLPVGNDIKLDHKAAVTAARSAYEALTTAQKGMVTNYDALTAAEAKIKVLEDAGGVSTDQTVANAVIAKINDLGTITSNTQKAAVEAARADYTKLTSDQKKLVSNLSKLEAAEAAIEALKPEITITVDVERFTIGQGFYVEPTTLSIKEGDTARQAIEKLLGAENLEGDVGYLRAVKGADTEKATIPKYIVDEFKAGDSNVANAYGQKYKGSSLGEFDYSSYSGWMYFVNNVTPDVGLNEKTLQNGDVLRLAFTYWATGGDLTGNGYIGTGTDRTPISMSFIPANKDSLLKAIATANSNSDYLTDVAVKTAYDTAMTMVQDMTAGKKDTNDAADALNKAMDEHKAMDAAAAKTVEKQIKDLPAVDKLVLSDKTIVTAARNAYAALTKSQQALVSNISTLTAAEAKIAALTPAPTPTPDPTPTPTPTPDPTPTPEPGTAKDDATGVEVIGLPTGTGIKVIGEEKDQQKAEAAEKAAEAAGITNAKVVSLYDIKPDISADELAKFNADPTTYVTITLPLNSDQQGYDNYVVYHKTEAGKVEWITPTLSADGKTLTFKVNAFSEFGVVGGKTETKTVNCSYQTQIENIGWQEAKRGGETSGTSQQSLRLEGIKINLDKAGYDLGVSYQTHVQDIGWQGFRTDGTLSGTENQAKRLEAIQIKLTGADADKFDIYYRVHAQNYGWLGWTKNGASAGTEGLSLRLEAIEIKVVAKDAAAPGTTDQSFVTGNINCSYQTQIENIGWQDVKRNGDLSGTTGQALRLEGVKINLDNAGYDVGLSYQTHVQDIGWQELRTTGTMSGTEGQSKRLEAIRISLTGTDAELCDIYYQVHAENIGWMGWAKNGESAGTEGFAYRLEGIRIMVVPKGSVAPGTTDSPFVSNK